MCCLQTLRAIFVRLWSWQYDCQYIWHSKNYSHATEKVLSGNWHIPRIPEELWPIPMTKVFYWIWSIQNPMNEIQHAECKHEFRLGFINIHMVTIWHMAMFPFFKYGGYKDFTLWPLLTLNYTFKKFYRMLCQQSYNVSSTAAKHLLKRCWNVRVIS